MALLDCGGPILESLVRTIGKHSGKVLSAIFVANDRLILTALTKATRFGSGMQTTEVFTTPSPDTRIQSSPSQSSPAEIGSSRHQVIGQLVYGDRIRLVEPPIVLRGHDGPVNTATFSPDEKQVLTSSEDGSAILWKLETGQPEQQLSGHHRSGAPRHLRSSRLQNRNDLRG